MYRLALGLTLSVGLSIGLNCGRAQAASLDMQPEVESNVWEENDQEFASVTLNGKELVTFKSNSQDESVEEQAESLADKLQDIIKDERFDAGKLSPAIEGQMAAIRIDGSTILKFDVVSNDASGTASDSSSNTSAALDASFKVVNSIRQAFGAPLIPGTFIKMAESKGCDQAFIACMTPHTAAPNSFSADFSGQASWYGGKFHGRRTSNGDVFNMNGLTAAHRTLPFGTKLLVMNRRTGDSCVVQVNDRGPFVDDRIIDLSRGAAEKLNMLSSGVAMVDCMVIDQ